MLLTMGILSIKPEERKPTLLAFLMFFSVVAASITGGSARDTFFLTEYDRSLLPLMFAIIAVVMVAVITLYNRISSGKDLGTIITTTSVIFIFSLAAIQSSLKGIMIPILYVLIEIMISISVLQFWILAGDIFNARQAKRLFSIIGAGGAIAGFSAGYGIKPFVLTFGAQNLLIPTIGFICLTILFAWLLNPFRNTTDIQPRPTYIHDEEQSRSSSSLLDPYLRSIAIMVVIAAISSRLIEYQFKMTAAETYPDIDSLAAFFGTYYMIVNGATLIIQFFITRLFLSRFGIIGGLLVLPISLILGSMAFFAAAGIVTVFIARFADQVFKFSIQNASREILWLPVDKQKARRAKPVIDSSIRSIMEGTIGIIIFLIVSLEYVPIDKLHWLSVPVIGLCCIWFWNNFRLKDGYLRTLMKAIEQRQLNLEDIQFDIADSQTILTIDKALKDDNEFKQLFALDLLKPLPLHPFKKTLVNLIESGSLELRKQILNLAGSRTAILNDDVILNATKTNDEASAYAITIAVDRSLVKLSDSLLKNLGSGNEHIQAASAVGSLRMKIHEAQAKKILDDFLDVKDEHTTAVALHYLQASGDLLPNETLIKLLTYPSLEIREAALKVAGNRNEPSLLTAIIFNLGSSETAHFSRNTLARFLENDVVDSLSHSLSDDNISKSLTLGIVHCLEDYSTTRSVRLLRTLLIHGDIDIMVIAARSLLVIARSGNIVEEFEEPFIEEMEQIAKQCYGLEVFRSMLSKQKNVRLIRDQISSEKKKSIQILLRLCILHIPETPIESYVQYIFSNNENYVPFVLEFLDSSCDKDVRSLILPLIDREMDPVSRGQELFSEIAASIEHYLKVWAESGHEWKSAISIQCLLESENISSLKTINWDMVNPSIYLAQLFKDRLVDDTKIPLAKFQTKTESTMYTILERTILLKSVDLFRNIPGEVLSRIAQISRAKRYEEGESIFKEGDEGDSLYVIFDGSVSIHSGEKEIAHLEKGASLGEMALLDKEPRSADATAEQNIVLLKIDQIGFYELMEGNVEIMKQILLILTKRIRDMNTKLEAEVR